MNFPPSPEFLCWPRSLSRYVTGALVGFGMMLGTGCTSVRTQIAVPGPLYTPANIHRAAETLPRGMQRVAVLPLVTRGVVQEAEGRKALEEALAMELGKAGRFEVVRLRRADLREWTGRDEWTAGENLPKDFFDRVRAGSGCDGVLFVELTEYRAYPPLAVGWKLRLVDMDGPNVWWAVDEVFDAGQTEVANSAKRFHLAQAGKPMDLTDPGAILYSPRRFGNYTANALVATCPMR